MGQYGLLIVIPLNKAYEGEFLIHCDLESFTSIVMAYTWWWSSTEILDLIRLSRWWYDEYN